MAGYEREMDPVIADLRAGKTGYEVLDGEGPYPERIGAVQEDGTAVYAHRVADPDTGAAEYDVTLFARTSPVEPAPSAGSGAAHPSMIDDVVGSVKHLLRGDEADEGEQVVRPLGRTAITITQPYDEDDPDAFFDRLVTEVRDAQD